MRNIKLILEYDGAEFAGWQRQTGEKTIQGELEKALSILLQEDISVTGAGRTDSGVHASSQVANFRCDSIMEISKMKKGIQALISDTISVLDADEVSPDFHSRYDAKTRLYSYYINTNYSAIRRNYSWYVKYKLDFEILNTCAAKILGTHDFSGFCKLNSNVKHHLCNVIKSQWSVNQQLIRYDIEANRFLHGMVRSLVGSMIDVSRGYYSIGDFEVVLNEQNRDFAGQSAPPQGLFLEQVKY